MKRFTILLGVVALVAMMSVAYAANAQTCSKSAAAGCASKSTAQAAGDAAGCASKAAAGCATSAAACADKISASFASVKMGECCVTAATAGDGCCGHDADAVKASYATYRAEQRAAANMVAQCSDASTGCTVKDEAAMKAKFAAMVVEAKAELAALDGMHPCCAEAVEASNGCCGMDAETLDAKYHKNVEKAKSEMKTAMNDGSSSEG